MFKIELILSIITLLVTSSSSDTVTFNCNFFNQSYVDLKYTLCCRPNKNLSIQQEFANISINNSQKLANVLGFSVVDQPVHFLPRNIQNFFPKLEVLELFKTGLKKISSSDLKSLEKLKFLSLSHNNIGSLEANLFQHNRGLKTIILNNNRINLIEPTAFKGLTELRHLQLQNNHCIDKAASKNLDVENLIDNSKIICSKIVVELQHKILNIDEKFTKIIEGTEKLPSESENVNIWRKMKEWFKSYMNMNNKAATTKVEYFKIISTQNEEMLNRSFIEFNNNETFEMIVKSIFESTNMKEIQKDIEIFKEIIAESQESKIMFRFMIFLLIGLSLLTYSYNLFIMFYLYPKTGDLCLNNQQQSMSVENIYDDIPVRYVPDGIESLEPTTLTS